jgi:radical SAM superfamily enzyme YgiQ (UPF0313 family)
MNNLIFISLPKVETTFPPGALAILSSVAHNNNFNVKIFDYNLDLFENLSSEDWDQLESWCSFSGNSISPELEDQLKTIFLDKLTELVDTHTKFICFSVFSYFSNRIAEKILSWYQSKFNIISVVGGNGLSTATSSSNKQLFGQYLIENKLGDYIVFGEGELVLDQLLKGNTSYPGINQNNPIQIDDLSELPIPSYDYFDMAKYQTKKILVTGSRGCIRDCTFCDIGLTWPKFRYRSARHIVEEIKRNFYEYGISEFEFTDSLINGSVSNFIEFNELLYDEKQRDPAMESVRYQGQFICRPAEHQKEIMYELMHHAGCSMIITGIESFSNDVRTHMRKKFSNSDIDYHFEQCARWSIPNTVLMIVGYPTETQKDHQANIDALIKYKKYADMGVIFMLRWGYTMHLFKNTPITDAYMTNELQLNLDQSVEFNNAWGWTIGSNPTNTTQERLRRRLELHELSVKLGYPMPRVREELLILKSIAEQFQPEQSQQPTKKIIGLTQI